MMFHCFRLLRRKSLLQPFTFLTLDLSVANKRNRITSLITWHLILYHIKFKQNCCQRERMKKCRKKSQFNWYTAKEASHSATTTTVAGQQTSANRPRAKANERRSELANKQLLLKVVLLAAQNIIVVDPKFTFPYCSKCFWLVFFYWFCVNYISFSKVSNILNFQKV